MAKKESTKKTATKAKATKTAAIATVEKAIEKAAKKTAKASAPKAKPTAKAQSKKSEARSEDNFFTRTYLESARTTLDDMRKKLGAIIADLEDVRDLVDDALGEIAYK